MFADRMTCRHLLLANRSRRSKWKSGYFFGRTSWWQVLEILYGRACSWLALNRWDGRPKLAFGAKWIWQSNRDRNMFHTCTHLTAWYQLADVDTLASKRLAVKTHTNCHVAIMCWTICLEGDSCSTVMECVPYAVRSRSDLAYRPSATQIANIYDGEYWGSLQIENEIFSSGRGSGDQTDQTHATSTQPEIDKLHWTFHPFKCQCECEWHLAAMNCTISYTRSRNVTLWGDREKKILSEVEKQRQSEPSALNTATFQKQNCAVVELASVACHKRECRKNGASSNWPNCKSKSVDWPPWMKLKRIWAACRPTK